MFGFVDLIFVRREFDGVGVLGLKFRRLITVSGSYKINPATRNSIYIFFSPIEVKNIYLKVEKKSSLVICVIYSRIIFLIFLLYTNFKGPKHPISKN